MEPGSIFAIILGILMYFIPTGVAMVRKHKSVLAIMAMNILLGWTVLCWLWAFIWSLTGNVAEKKTGAKS